MKNAIAKQVAVAAFAAFAALCGISANAGIKDAYAGRFRLGAAITPRVYAGEPNDETRIVKENFNSITPENEMKPEALQPAEGVFHWDVADKFVAFGEKNHMKIIGHCLVWHSQTPKWFFENPDGSKADRDTLMRRMRDHIHAVVGRYKGRINGWDVVNEAFDDSGNLHPSPWRDGIGDDFIELAFKFAHEADPNAELYYNDFNMFEKGKREGVVKMIKDFKAKGIRIDAVGLQSHGALKSPEIKDYEDTIKAIAAQGVKAMITELDVSVLPSAWGLSAELQARHDYDEKYNPWKDGSLPVDVQKEQAKRYVDLFRMYLRNADKIDRVTLWGVSDRDSWLNDFPVKGRTDYPLFFDRQMKKKPCAKAIERLGALTRSRRPSR